jgi:predicted SprT family Zn-dependent metalloprotease
VSTELPFRLTERAARIRERARALLDEHGLSAWEFGFNANVRRAGVCFYPHGAEPGRIELSVHFAARNSDSEVRDTLLHEIAHALVGPGHGHDAVWKAKCREIGARPEACYGADVEMPRGRWRATCPGCAVEFDRHRKPARAAGWFCRPCGPKAGRLLWHEASD